eukprot:8435719-Heterocapsa_arctica.AAC.2
MHHMFGEGRQQWFQEHEDRDQQQHHYRALDRDEGEHPVQELDHPAENRRVVRIHGKCFDIGAQDAGQHGGGANVAQTSHQLYAHGQYHGVHLHADDRVQ